MEQSPYLAIKISSCLLRALNHMMIQPVLFGS